MTRTGETRALLQHKELPPPSVVKGKRGIRLGAPTPSWWRRLHVQHRLLCTSSCGARRAATLAGVVHDTRVPSHATRAESDLVISSKSVRRGRRSRRAAAPTRLLLAGGPRWAQPPGRLPSRRRKSPLGDGVHPGGTEHGDLSWSSRRVVRHNEVRAALWGTSRTVRPARCKSQRIRAFDNRSFGYQTHTDPQRYDGRESPPDTRPSGLSSGSPRVGQNDGRGWLRAQQSTRA